MNKPNPDITVITNKPNNGYFAMVFTDNTTDVDIQCMLSDLYGGLVQIVSDVLIECADKLVSMPDPSVSSKEFAEGSEKYLNTLAGMHIEFFNKVKEQLAITSLSNHLEKQGLSKEFSSMLAEGAWKLPGVFEAVLNSMEKYKEENPDDDD